ncbi:MAG: vWA domain-containing protein [Ignavibacteria bacterium]
MFNIDNINLSLSYSPVYFFIGLILIAAYTIYSYRYTTPPVAPLFRFGLISLRTAALLMILFVIFEPVLNLSRKSIVKPVNLIFVDNTRSILIEDGTKRKETETEFLKKLSQSRIKNNSELYSFGTEVKRVSIDSSGSFTFNNGSTNFSKIFSGIKADEKNISSVTIVSDGVITDGANPVYQAEKLSIPVYTVGTGDTTKKDNLAVSRVLFNEYVYTRNQTVINAVITNTGFNNKTVLLTLLEDNSQIYQQDVKLSASGINNFNIPYTPKSPGEKKLMLKVSELAGEFTYVDNKKIFYINILNNKFNTLIIAGSPSADLSFIRNTLQMDENLKVQTITQVAPDKFLENVNQNRLIDSSGIIFLIGFPSLQTPDALLQRVLKEIRDRNKPCFLVISASTDFNRLKAFQAELPFTIGKINTGFTDVQPNVATDPDNPLLQNNSNNTLEAWNNLPPVPKPNVELSAKPESNILSKIKINNIPLNAPLLLSRKMGSKRSIAILAKDVWRWKLQTAEKKLDVFDRFILSGIKWLNMREDQKQVDIRTVKKIYSPGEPIEFTARVYDETFNPLDNAEVNVSVKSGSENYLVSMNPLSNGLYEGSLITSKSGDYSYSGEVKMNERIIGKDAGRFNVGDVDMELINPRMDKDFLLLLSRQTGGKFFYGKNYDRLFDVLQELNLQKSKDKITSDEIILWSSEWMLSLIILLFSVEWFLRKRAGML